MQGMNAWISVGLNGIILGVAVSAVGYIIRRWTKHVDEKLDHVEDRLREMELKLANEFVSKMDYEGLRQQNSESHGNLWSEYRKMDRDTRDRLTVIETTLKIKRDP